MLDFAAQAEKIFSTREDVRSLQSSFSRFRPVKKREESPLWYQRLLSLLHAVMNGGILVVWGLLVDSCSKACALHDKRRTSYILQKLVKGGIESDNTPCG